MLTHREERLKKIWPLRLSSTHTWVFNDKHTHHTLDLQARDRVILPGGQRCSQIATVQTVEGLSVYVCAGMQTYTAPPPGVLNGAENGHVLVVQWSPAWAQHRCPAASLPRSVSRCGLRGFFSCGLKSALCLCTVSSSPFSSPFSFAVLSSLFMQLIWLMNQYKHKVHFMREIFTGDIKPHITTAQMEQKHMTDNPCSGKK